MATLKFTLGHCLITSNALNTLHPEDVYDAIVRHGTGEWGDVCGEDHEHNELALQHGDRLFSVYHDRNGMKFYIITEHDRSATNV